MPYLKRLASARNGREPFYKPNLNGANADNRMQTFAAVHACQARIAGNAVSARHPIREETLTWLNPNNP